MTSRILVCFAFVAFGCWLEYTGCVDLNERGKGLTFWGGLCFAIAGFISLFMV